MGIRWIGERENGHTFFKRTKIVIKLTPASRAPKQCLLLSIKFGCLNKSMNVRESERERERERKRERESKG